MAYRYQSSSALTKVLQKNWLGFEFFDIHSCWSASQVNLVVMYQKQRGSMLSCQSIS